MFKALEDRFEQLKATKFPNSSQLKEKEDLRKQLDRLHLTQTSLLADFTAKLSSESVMANEKNSLELKKSYEPEINAIWLQNQEKRNLLERLQLTLDSQKETNNSEQEMELNYFGLFEGSHKPSKTLASSSANSRSIKEAQPSYFSLYSSSREDEMVLRIKELLEKLEVVEATHEAEKDITKQVEFKMESLESTIKLRNRQKAEILAEMESLKMMFRDLKETQFLAQSKFVKKLKE